MFDDCFIVDVRFGEPLVKMCIRDRGELEHDEQRVHGVERVHRPNEPDLRGYGLCAVHE